MGLKDLPIDERPREKALLYGIESLADNELIGLLLRSGGVSLSAPMLGAYLLNKFKGLAGLSEATLKELMEVSGLKEVKGLELLGAFELGKRMVKARLGALQNITFNSKLEVFNYLKLVFLNHTQEEFRVLLLNSRNELLGEKTLFIGRANFISINPSIIIQFALTKPTAKIIISHNHPSNNVNPSEEDIKMTKNFSIMIRFMGIELYDHLIIGVNKYYSLLEEKEFVVV